MSVLERVLLVVFALFALCALAEKYHGHQVISFQVHTENQARSLVTFIENNANFRLWTENVVVPGTVDIQVHPSMVRDLISHASNLRVQHAVLHKDLQKDIDELFEINTRIQSASSSNFFDSYATYDQMQTFLQQLVQTYPTIAKLVNVGTTIEGREITGVVITGTGSSPKPQIVINGCQHAREWISPMTVAYLAQAFCQNYTTIAEVTGLVDNFEWTIIPIVNADGYVYTFTDDRMWRKNRRQNQHSTCYGVDINRNWNFEWGTGGSSSIACSETYMGPSGFSEPEETALANYISSLDNIVAYIDFHAYGELFMYPWGYTCSSWVSNNVTEDNCAKQFAAAVKSVHNQVFTVGPVCQTIYLASGGSNDWTYGAASVPYSFACELRGNSFILPPDQILPSGQEIFAGVQAMGEFIIKNPTGAPTFVR